jgi:hypothetical protein
VSLNPATGQIDRRYLPAEQAFDFLIRAASELRELRGEYLSPSRADPTLLEPWIRRAGTKSSDATLRVDKLSPGTTYRFRFILVQQPTGNEGRLIEAGVLDALREAFRCRPAEPLEEAAALAAPRVKAALDSVLPGAVAASPSPLTGKPAAVVAALDGRGIDVLHEDYRRQLILVGTLWSGYRTARNTLAREPALARTVETLAARIARRHDVAELEAPLAACRTVRDSRLLGGPDSIRTDRDQLALLGALKEYDAAIGSCRALFRDVRLPRYAAVRPAGAWAAADIMIPTGHRLEALRSETERLLALWRKREGTLAQVATDVRRGLDTQVTLSDTIEASLGTQPRTDVPPKTTLGIGLAGTLAPCTIANSCVRIVPVVTLGFRLTGLLSTEVGLTLADTEAPGRTRHLFWFTSGMTGVSVRLGATGSQRIGAGALILRQADGDDFDSFRLGGYLSFTVYDFRL